MSGTEPVFLHDETAFALARLGADCCSDCGSVLKHSEAHVANCYKVQAMAGDCSIDFSLLLDEANYTQSLLKTCLKQGVFFEPEVVDVLFRHLRAGDNFIDVGGHIGYFSLIASQIVGSGGLVVACEPTVVNARHILDHIAINGCRNLHVANLAISNQVGRTDFYINSDNDGGHALWDVGQHPFNSKSRQAVTVQNVCMTTLDQLAETYPLLPVRMIKIDTEGAELSVLRGARELLTTHAVPYVIAEVNEFGLKQMGTSESQLRGFMHELGYVMYELAPLQAPRLVKIDQACQQSALFNVLFEKT